MYLITDLKLNKTFTIEVRRRGARPVASVMSAAGNDVDVRIEWRRVPLYIRRAAVANFNPLT